MPTLLAIIAVAGAVVLGVALAVLMAWRQFRGVGVLRLEPDGSIARVGWAGAGEDERDLSEV